MYTHEYSFFGKTNIFEISTKTGIVLTEGGLYSTRAAVNISIRVEANLPHVPETIVR